MPLNRLLTFKELHHVIPQKLVLYYVQVLLLERSHTECFRLSSICGVNAFGKGMLKPFYISIGGRRAGGESLTEESRRWTICSRKSSDETFLSS